MDIQHYHNIIDISGCITNIICSGVYSTFSFDTWDINVIDSTIDRMLTNQLFEPNSVSEVVYTGVIVTLCEVKLYSCSFLEKEVRFSEKGAPVTILRDETSRLLLFLEKESIS